MKKIHMLVNPNDRKSHINKEIYGHFTEHLGRCIYNGIYVGPDSPIPNTRGIRNDIIEALKEIRVPVLRWPGGCFADTYHWKDGIGPVSERKHITNVNWGCVEEDNSFGTHEFFDLCELVGAEPYLAGNVGSGSVQELADWIDYITFDGKSPMADLRRENGREKPWRLKYLGIGNESWGCGGNMMADQYAAEYRKFSSFCRNYGDNKLYRVACGGDEAWNETLLKKLRSDAAPELLNAITLHYYTILGDDFAHKGSATDFTEEEYYQGLKNTQGIENAIARNSKMLDLHDPDRKLGLIVDEWGCWYDVEPGTNPGFLYQQNTMRDAVIAANYLNIFNAHSSRVVMANLAQTVNVLQAIILTDGDRMVKTPTYHVMDLFKEHMDSTLLYSFADNECENGVSCISQSASVDESGRIHITVANASLHQGYSLCCQLPYIEVAAAGARILSGEVHAHNTFGEPDRVAVGEHMIKYSGNEIETELPPCSVVSVEIVPR